MEDTKKLNTSVAIIGAGPAGLTASYLLSKKKIPCVVIEADEKYVGGISKTIQYKGYYFDIGGHRFFSKSKEVEDLWTEILGPDMLERPRSSRIFYRGKFFAYPLKAVEALFKLGLGETFLCVLSYAKAKVSPVKNPTNLHDWVTNQFGTRLFRIFFKTYTEKVWGMDCKEISADWAAQRIKGLSLTSAVWNAVKPKMKPKSRDKIIKTLIESFRYPRKGPGMMWDQAAKKTREWGGVVEMGFKALGCSYDKASALWTTEYANKAGEKKSVTSKHIISSAPMRELVESLQPRASEKALQAARSLRYRDFITVSLILKERDLFDDNWIYIHDPSVKVGRIQNFKSWSPEMVPDPSMCCYGMEYFCFEGDGMWTSSDADLIELAKTELEKIGLAKKADVTDGYVVRQQKAYPVYDDQYETHVGVIRKEIESKYPNLHLVGRNGMHKYNNQDHAMMTAMLCVENILADRQVFDLWDVNQDAEYHESGKAGAQSAASGLRSVPKRVSTESQPKA